MNKQHQRITPHPDFLETLFAYKSNVSAVFKDVLGLNDISHIAVSYINNQHQLLSLSSTPSLEFNLFSSPLWRFDKTYQSQWYGLCKPSTWQALYTPKRYDELYYLKQVKHRYPVGLSMATQSVDAHIIYSLASHHVLALTEGQYEDLYKIGAYCGNALLPIFLNAA